MSKARHKLHSNVRWRIEGGRMISSFCLLVRGFQFDLCSYRKFVGGRLEECDLSMGGDEAACLEEWKTGFLGNEAE